MTYAVCTRKWPGDYQARKEIAVIGVNVSANLHPMTWGSADGMMCMEVLFYQGGRYE